jgi:uncharacterized protein
VRTQNDFDYSLLDVTGHRPWPVPDGPWIMTQTWHDLLFAHWPVELDLLRSTVPPMFPVDTFDGRAWIGVIPFDMTNVAPRAMPALPRLSAFPELNVRTYVTVDGKPGVYFLSLDAANSLAVRVARLLFSLPYHTADMRVGAVEDWVTYSSRRSGTTGPPAQFTGRYRPTGAPVPPRFGTLEHFLTERYCLYTTDRRGRAYRLEIHHKPWPLQSADAAVWANTMADASGCPLPDVPPLLHFSRRQDVVAWPLTPIDAPGPPAR